VELQAQLSGRELGVWGIIPQGGDENEKAGEAMSEEKKKGIDRLIEEYYAEGEDIKAGTVKQIRDDYLRIMGAIVEENMGWLEDRVHETALAVALKIN